MGIAQMVYYFFCMVFWVGLTTLAVMAWRPDFPTWLQEHPQVLFYLLGVRQLPALASRVLKRFYFFLAGGWTWILIGSWWILPALRNYFFRSVPNETALQIARWSTWLVIGAYAGVGFFAIGRAFTIWLREIYFQHPKPTRK